MNITVTHTLAPEIVNLLQRLLQNQPAAETLATNDQVKDSLPVTKTKVKKLADTTTSVTTTDKEVTIEEVRAMVNSKAQDGKRDAVKALLTEFEAEKVTNLAKTQYADFLVKVSAL